MLKIPRLRDRVLQNEEVAGINVSPTFSVTSDFSSYNVKGLQKGYQIAEGSAGSSGGWGAGTIP